MRPQNFFSGLNRIIRLCSAGGVCSPPLTGSDNGGRGGDDMTDASDPEEDEKGRGDVEEEEEEFTSAVMTALLLLLEVEASWSSEGMYEMTSKLRVCFSPLDLLFCFCLPLPEAAEAAAFAEIPSP